MKRRLAAAIACRNQGARLYGKPLQNLDIQNGVRIIDHIISCLKSIDCIDEIVLGISEGVDNESFKDVAAQWKIPFVVGDQVDVLSRLIQCGRLANATDVFRVTSESPFLFFEPVEELFTRHQAERSDATMMGAVVDGCGFEILSLKALERSHERGDHRHRSELCSLYIREHLDEFRITAIETPPELIRPDLRLTVDYPEDLALCRAVYSHFKAKAPRIPVREIVQFLDDNPDLVAPVSQYTEAALAHTQPR